jgi:uncharacterized protein YjbI with pentapeptide repeats
MDEPTLGRQSDDEQDNGPADVGQSSVVFNWIDAAPGFKSWPPKMRTYAPEHPARRREQSREAFNEDWAREDFGDAVVNRLLWIHPLGNRFSGDLWIYAVLYGCMRVRQYVDGQQRSTRETWQAFLDAMRDQAVVVHLEGADLTLAKLAKADLEGVHLEYAICHQADLQGANLTGAHLEHASLQEAQLDDAILRSSSLEHSDFSRAQLRRASLVEAQLQSALLVEAHLEGAALIKAQLDNACLVNARMDQANLAGAQLVGARASRACLKSACLSGTNLAASNFRGANFEQADLRLAQLSQTRLEEATLTAADIRGALALRFDSNRVRDIKIEGNATDPWSVLRRSYTGPWFFVHATMLVVFVVPYVGKVLALTAADHAGRILGTTIERLPGASHIQIEYIPAWKVLIGLDQGWLGPVLAVVLLGYNVIRGFLTIRVGMLRDAEERSDITPMLKEYMGSQALGDEHGFWFLWFIVRDVLDWMTHLYGPEGSLVPLPSVGLWCWHRILNLLFWFAIISFAVHAICWIWYTTVPQIRVIA